MVARHDLDTAHRHTEVRGHQFAHGRIGLIVDRRRGRANQKTPAALAADLIALGSWNHPDRQTCRVGLVWHEHDDTTEPIERSRKDRTASSRHMLTR